MEVKIVPYNDKYAKAVAVMWSQSSQGWNGSEMSFSEESVINEEKKGKVATNLALSGDKVVGYCNLESGKFADAYYIGLLNVLPEMHGKKIGKRLILKALDKTIEDGIKRLDLHTWSGNTLAVPLYKKTGFLWRESPQGVHLVNYIPYLLTHDFFKEFFAKLDWYKDRSDEIIVEPDGRLIDNFYVYEYSWKNNQEELTIIIEDNGKSICGIETKDYSLSIACPNKDLTIGQEHIAEVTFTPKQDKNFDLIIDGVSNKYVNMDFHTKDVTNQKETFPLAFSLNPQDNSFVALPSLPTVGCNISINGKSIALGLGINPIYAVDLKFESKQDFFIKNSQTEVLLWCKNNSDKDIEIEIDLSSLECYTGNNLSISINSHKEASLTVPLTMTQSMSGKYIIPVKFIDTDIRAMIPMEVCLVLHNESKLSEFKSCLFYSYNNINYVLTKSGNRILRVNNNDCFSHLNLPILGDNYTNEFIKDGYEGAEVDSHNMSVTETMFSNIYPGLRIVRITSFDRNHVNVRLSAFNDSAKQISNIKLAQGIGGYPRYQHTYKDGIYNRGIDYPDLDPKNITEPWLLYKKDNSSILMLFSEHDSFEIIGWQWHLKKAIDSLSAKQECIVFDINYYFDLVSNYQQVRRNFFNKEGFLKEYSLFNVNTSDNNPVYDIDKTQKLEFSIEAVDIGGANVECNGHEIAISNNNFKDSFDALKEVGLNTYTLNFNQSNCQFTYKKCFLAFKAGSPITKKEDDSLIVSNAFIEISSDIKHHPGIYSLKIDNQEILDISYPNPKPHGWYNPWYGGIALTDQHNGAGRLMKEASSQKFVSVNDDFGNLWEGIRLSTKYSQADDWKEDVTINQFYLLLANSPVMIAFALFDYSHKKIDSNKNWNLEVFLGGADLKNYSVIAKEDNIQYRKINCGISQNSLESRVLQVKRKDCHSFIFFSSNPNKDSYAVGADRFLNLTSSNFLKRKKISDKKVISDIQFMVFTEDLPESEELHKIREISFNSLLK